MPENVVFSILDEWVHKFIADFRLLLVNILSI